MIRLLSKETIDKIAAGEVVERPENVAKELLDNAIDSGAGAVSVEIRGGGTELIRVTDNGCGIAKEDLANAFTRHATSKLSCADDLNHIRTMGFRGEALASIAGVSRVEMITRRSTDLTGTRYVIEGGKEISVRDVGIPSGTTVLVRDLFYNVPVRRQFLKAPATEASYVRDIAEKAALSCPGISFSFLNDGRQIFHTTGSGKLKDVIYTVYGHETVSSLLPVQFSDSQGTVTGYLSKPCLSRTRRDSELYFVNGRYVKSAVICRAIETAYEGYLMQHRFPFTVLMIGVEPEKVDVNIHPKKTEVRFSDDEKIFDLVYNAVRYTLSHREHIEDALRKEEGKKPVLQPHVEPFETNRQTRRNGAQQLQLLREEMNPAGETGKAVYGAEGSRMTVLKDGAGSGTYRAAENGTEAGEPAVTGTEKSRERTEAGEPAVREKQEQLTFMNREARKNYKFIGQVFDTYWLIEYGDALYIVDQHAAHEKVSYEYLMETIGRGEKYSQNIIPVLITLPSREAALLEERLEEFAAFGYDIESAGDRDFCIRSVPASLPGLSERELLTEMIEGLSDIRPELSRQLLREKIASMSCKAAVKGNQRLSEAEMRALTDRLLNCADPYHCPHGRPVMVKFSRYELDKMFKRIV